MLFISVRSAMVENVPKVLRVVEEIRRLRHKAGMCCLNLSCLTLRFRTGLDEEGQLHQYVIYEQVKPKGPKIIKLDDPKGKNSDIENYTPPTSLTVHLSKIDMPELKPRVNSQPPGKDIVKEWEKKGKNKDKEKEKGKPTKKDKRKEDEKKPKSSPSPKPPQSPEYSTPPPIPEHSRPNSNLWALYPSLFNQAPYPQESGALNTAAPTPPPPQFSSVVSSLVGRFARR